MYEIYIIHINIYENMWLLMLIWMYNCCKNVPNKHIPFWGELALWEKEHFLCYTEHFQIQSKPKKVVRVRFWFTVVLNWREFTGWAEKSNWFQFLKKQWCKESKTRGMMTYRKEMWHYQWNCTMNWDLVLILAHSGLCVAIEFNRVALSEKLKLSQCWWDVFYFRIFN